MTPMRSLRWTHGNHHESGLGSRSAGRRAHRDRRSAVDEWVRLGQQPLRDFFQWCQAVSALLGAGARPTGRVIVLVPSMSLAGSPGLVAVDDSGRGPAFARQGAGARVGHPWHHGQHALRCRAAVLTGQAGDGEAPLDRPGLQPLSLAALPTLRDEVAGVLASMLEPAWAAVTGATLAVDGGQWMPS